MRQNEQQHPSNCCQCGATPIKEKWKDLVLHKIYEMLQTERRRLNIIVSERSLNYTPQEYAGIMSASARLEICEELIGAIDARSYYHATK